LENEKVCFLRPGFFHISLDKDNLGKFHHYVSGRSDNLYSQENVFQPKGFDNINHGSILKEYFLFLKILTWYPNQKFFVSPNG